MCVCVYAKTIICVPAQLAYLQLASDRILKHQELNPKRPCLPYNLPALGPTNLKPVSGLGSASLQGPMLGSCGRRIGTSANATTCKGDSAPSLERAASAALFSRQLASQHHRQFAEAHNYTLPNSSPSRYVNQQSK